MSNKLIGKKLNISSGFTIKSTEEDGDSIKIEGYANTTTKDRIGDVIVEEAWKKGGLNNYLKNPIILAYHNHSKPIGRLLEYSIDAYGLKVVAEIVKGAGDVYELVKENILKSFSVGFIVRDADYDHTTDIFVIKDLELLEISVVSVPANADSTFSVKKSLQTEEEYLNIKQSFNTETEDKTKVENTTVSKKEKKVEDENKVSLTKEELEAAKTKAVEDALAKLQKDAEAAAALKATAVEAGKSGAEELLKEMEKKFADEAVTLKSTLDEFRNELKEKSAELDAIRKSKMAFEERGGKTNVSQKDIMEAVMLSKILKKDVKDTKFAKNIIEKAGAHLASMTDDWENTFSTQMYEAIMDKLVMEPLFSNRIQMNSRTMSIPYNPEAGYAAWIADNAYNGANSTGTAGTHLIEDIVLKAEKLASKEYIGYEEEEDAIIPLLGIINAAVVRRMARSSDTELLRANAGANSGSGNAPASINGVATLAIDNSATVVLGGTVASPSAVTVAALQAVRRKMGRYGLNPSDVVYIVSESAYYDLLEDPDFRTMDMVGPNATILRGQIGTCNGSRVIVSDSFAAKAANLPLVVAMNASNYLFGELRGLTVERDRDIEMQRNIIVATRRFAFNQIIPSTGSSAALVYAAS